MRRKIVIVADDLTGACDTGVQFSRAGLTVNVIIGQEGFREEIERCDVLVVDLESRLISADKAFINYFLLGRQLKQYGDILIYKKLDSTLRGNVGAELDGLMDGLGIGTALLAPALPLSGRTVVGGTVFVHGVSLAETEFACDPRTPVKHSFIPDIIAVQSNKSCYVITTGQPEFINNGIYIFDSKCEQDLEKIAQIASEHSEGPILIAGSSGLARHLAHALNCSNISFVFAGSVSHATREQVQYAREHADAHVLFLSDLRPERFDEIISDVRDVLAGGRRRIIFTTALSRSDVRFEATNAAVQLGKLAALLITTFHPSGVLLTGGETAIHTVQALGGKGLRIKDEILPGIQYGYLAGEHSPPITIVTKAGGFGEEDTIFKIFEFLNK